MQVELGRLDPAERPASACIRHTRARTASQIDTNRRIRNDAAAEIGPASNRTTITVDVHRAWQPRILLFQNSRALKSLELASHGHMTVFDWETRSCSPLQQLTPHFHRKSLLRGSFLRSGGEVSGERARVSFQVQLPYQQYSRAPVQWQERQEETARVRASSVRRQQTPQCFRSRHFDSRKRRSCQRTPSPSPEAAMLASAASLSSDGPSQSRHLIPALQSTNGDKLSLAPRERQLLSDLTSPVVAVSSSPLSYHWTTNNRAPGHSSSSCCRTCLASLPNRPGSTCASRPKTSRFGWCARRQKDRSVNFAKPPTCLPRLPQRWGASSSLCQASSSNTATSWKMRPCWTTKGSIHPGRH